MRTWPYQMLNVLPYKQLLSQWRECLAISGMIYGNGSNISLENVNHATINRIKDYPLDHFIVYCDLVRQEFINRGWTIGTNTIEKLNREINFENRLKELEKHLKISQEFIFIEGNRKDTVFVNNEKLFGNFHNERYIIQCLYSFQEKYDIGMISNEEWKSLEDKFNYLLIYNNK